MDRDADWLKLLQILYCVLTLLACLCLIAGIVQLLLGLFVVGQVANVIVTWLGIYTIVGSTISIPLSILAIFCFRKGRHYGLCFGIAIFSCVAMFPIGMLIGVASLVILSHDSVKSLFQ
jgi:hypothetical protein